jgi:hypothetical protein
MSKQEAERLADALVAAFPGFGDGTRSDRERLALEAAAKLRQWPEGEPRAWLVEGWHDGKLIAYIVHPTLDEADHSASVFSAHYSTVHKRPLYTAPTDQSARIAGLEAQMVALFRSPEADGARIAELESAIDDALVSAHIGTLERFPNPRAAIHALEAWNATVALDPAVSQDAAKLHERIAELERERADFHMQYRVQCDAETKAQALRISELEHQRDALLEACRQSRNTMESVRVFVTTREKIIDPTGIAWYDREIADVCAAIQAQGSVSGR